LLRRGDALRSVSGFAEGGGYGGVQNIVRATLSSALPSTVRRDAPDESRRRSEASRVGASPRRSKRSHSSIPSTGTIKKRFPDETIQALLEIAWWDWDAERISRSLEAIVGADLEALRG
jgi:hypothetical protein